MSARTAFLLSTLLLAGCAAASTSPRYVDGGEWVEGRRRSSVGHVRIEVDERTAPPNLITLIQSRVSSVQVRRSGGCPHLEFRGRNNVARDTPPSIYVDGQHVVSTCVLDMLSPHDVAAIEVYPMGVSNRPGYFNSAGGLILVFSKTAKG